MPSNPLALSVLERKPELGWNRRSRYNGFGMKRLIPFPLAVSPSKDGSL